MKRPCRNCGNVRMACKARLGLKRIGYGIPQCHNAQVRMACKARLGLKLNPVPNPDPCLLRQNGLQSPPGIETAWIVAASS